MPEALKKKGRSASIYIRLSIASWLYFWSRVITLTLSREHDILVIKEDGTAENITKYPFGPDYNVV